MKASIAGPTMPRKARPAPKRGPGQSIVEGASLRLADEVRYIIRRAAAHDGRVVTIGQLTLFSTETGDAWTSTATITSRCGLPVTATTNRSTSKKPTLPLR